MPAPASAVHPGNLVWVVKDGRLRQRHVRVANTERRSILVYENEDAVVAGDSVVISPLASPKDGAEVRVRGQS